MTGHGSLTTIGVLFLGLLNAGAEEKSLRVQVSFGQRSPKPAVQSVRIFGGSAKVTVSPIRSRDLEPNDQLGARALLNNGAGDVDTLEFEVRWTESKGLPIKLHRTWEFLLEHTEPGAAERLRTDPAFRADEPLLTIEMSEDGTRGFTVSLAQLQAGAIWLPESDAFLTGGDAPIDFATHSAQLKGERILDRVKREPEATYKQFTQRWADMGNPAAPCPSHIVGLTWDSALYKFGVGRSAQVCNDFGKLEEFHFRFVFAEDAKTWRGQTLADGLPILTTTFENDGIHYQVEQFAIPLNVPPMERRGDIPMVLMQRVTVRELEGKARPVSVGMVLERNSGAAAANREGDGAFVLEEGIGLKAQLAVQGLGISVTATAPPVSPNALTKSAETVPSSTTLTASFHLLANGTHEFIVKLPFPGVAAADRPALLALDYTACRAAMVKFWSNYLAQGAQFRVPEEAVNTLFRANLWHALRLPRRHGGAGADVVVDLPYTNFGYGQFGTPWPVNQSVYVDYMLYDLRGYHALSDEELEMQFRRNQQSNGRVTGFAEWGVYTPGMLYAVAQHYLLSGDREAFEKLLPRTLLGLDWCLGETKRSSVTKSATPGLVLLPLNDVSHEDRPWAFNQAYFFAGLDLLGRALAEIHHPRAAECRAAAEGLRVAVEREFARASVLSPAVPLADGTWMPYVPCDALTRGRMLSAWYPTDVDTGALHLSRLKVLDPRGPLTTSLLNDHEDNLLLNQWGMANEPVYNQQATAYLLRDEPKPAIRAFYSMMACAFSQSVFEPVEHRWGWPQYFGPPSTDGAWFELYRNLLIRELEGETLLLGQAPPRQWLEEGKRIEVERAPTYYGPLSFQIESRVATGQMTATIEVPARKPLAALLVRFRHPHESRLRAVIVNGKPWKDFDAAQEWVRIPQPQAGHLVVVAQYGSEF